LSQGIARQGEAEAEAGSEHHVGQNCNQGRINSKMKLPSGMRAGGFTAVNARDQTSMMACGSLPHAKRAGKGRKHRKRTKENKNTKSEKNRSKQKSKETGKEVHNRKKERKRKTHITDTKTKQIGKRRENESRLTAKAQNKRTEQKMQCFCLKVLVVASLFFRGEQQRYKKLNR
jgi:hypothetical protein